MNLTVFLKRFGIKEKHFSTVSIGQYTLVHVFCIFSFSYPLISTNKCIWLTCEIMISGLAEFSDVTVFFQGAFKQTNKQGLI